MHLVSIQINPGNCKFTNLFVCFFSLIFGQFQGYCYFFFEIQTKAEKLQAKLQWHPIIISLCTQLRPMWFCLTSFILLCERRSQQDNCAFHFITFLSLFNARKLLINVMYYFKHQRPQIILDFQRCGDSEMRWLRN